MSKVGMTMQLAGMAVGYAGAMGAADAARKAGRFNRDVASRNAHMLELAADEAVLNNSLDIVDFRAQYGAFEKQTELAIQSSGFDAYSGTGLQILLANAEEAEENIRRLRRAGQIERQSLRERAVASSLQGELAMFEGEQQARAIKVKATATLLQQGGEMIPK